MAGLREEILNLEKLLKEIESEEGKLTKEVVGEMEKEVLVDAWLKLSDEAREGRGVEGGEHEDEEVRVVDGWLVSFLLYYFFYCLESFYGR